MNLYRDTSELPTTGVLCNVVVDDKTITVYTTTDTTSYKLISNKYIASQSAHAQTPPAQAVCHSQSDIDSLPSAYDFITPVYYNMALLAAVAIFYAAYRILIYPFFRKV